MNPAGFIHPGCLSARSIADSPPAPLAAEARKLTEVWHGLWIGRISGAPPAFLSPKEWIDMGRNGNIWEEKYNVKPCVWDVDGVNAAEICWILSYYYRFQGWRYPGASNFCTHLEARDHLHHDRSGIKPPTSYPIYDLRCPLFVPFTSGDDLIAYHGIESQVYIYIYRSYLNKIHTHKQAHTRTYIYIYTYIMYVCMSVCLSV